MNCRDFQRQWDELLDTEAAPAGLHHAGASPASESSPRPPVEDWEEALLAHAAGCETCRQLAARYQAFRHALRAWIRTPPPSVDLTERILVAASAPAGSTWAVVTAPARRPRPWRLVASVAAAAMAVALLLRVIHPLVQSPRPDRRPVVGPVAVEDSDRRHSVSSPETGPNDHRGLQRAVAEATSATWDLAWSASEPAARISRDILDATLEGQAFQPDAPRSENARSELRLGPAEAGVVAPVSILIPQAPDAATASAVLQQVGDHLAAGVRPLSSSARHAFGFLLGEPPDRPGLRGKRSPAKGA
jgi:hypothetical protein